MFQKLLLLNKEDNIMAIGNRMKAYVAPDGYVYDWAVPHTATIINLDGTKETVEEHMYVKQLVLGSMDSIDEYKLVKDPKARG